MLSFISPAYNAEKYIGAAILSCTRQVPEGEYEILVCDDASTDNTAQVVRNLAERIPEIKLYQHDENKGVCHSRNLLLQSMSSATEYVAFLDADDVFRDRAIASCIEKLERQPDAEAIFGKLQIVRSEALDSDAPISDQWPVLTAVTMSAGVFRESIIRKVGLFDASFAYGEDIDFLLRMAEITGKQPHIDDVIFYYRRHDTNATNAYKKTRMGFMRALLLHSKRRGIDPSLKDASGFFRPVDPDVIRKVAEVQYG